MQVQVEIKIPTAHTTLDSRPYTLYDISLRLPLRTWTVSKRYSEFAVLHHELSVQAGAPPPASLPPKHYFANTTGNAALTENRRTGLEAYLQAIDGGADPRWRDTAAWRTFLNLPSNMSGRSGGTLPVRNAASNRNMGSDPALWLDLHRRLKRLLREARSLIAPKPQAEALTMNHETSVAAKSVLARAETLLDNLDRGLASSQDEWGKEPLGEGELRRRRDLVAAGRKEKGDLENLILKMAQKREVDQVLEGNRELLGPATKSSAVAKPHSAAKPLGKGRVIGRESSKTRELDNEGVLQLQKQTLQDQEEDVEIIAQAVRRQRELAIKINEELAVQNEMLSILDEDATRLDAEISVAKKKIAGISL